MILHNVTHQNGREAVIFSLRRSGEIAKRANTSTKYQPLLQHPEHFFLADEDDKDYKPNESVVDVRYVPALEIGVERAYHLQEPRQAHEHRKF